jgi:16S rRNA (cytosine967-C5)-methyltransferase
MKFDNQLRHAAGIIHAYKGEIPLHTWLKDFFRVNKQMGSRDRKLLSNLVYGFYRLGQAVKAMSVEERLLLGLFLSNETPGELLEYFRPEWYPQATRPPEEKIAIARASGIGIAAEDIFPYKEQLSAEIDHHSFCLSFLKQPDLFLRIRPGYQQEVLQKLPDQEYIPPFSLRLPNGFKVEEYFTPDKEVVIQDYSSQRIAGFIKPVPGPDPHHCWDACAASGGKSILAVDCYPNINITVSDIRESILHNLRQRFRQAGIKKYNAFVADLTSPSISIPPSTGPSSFDLILADVPCTGSGTWSRTPEELYFFDPKKIDRYTGMQKKIFTNIIPRLAKGGHLVYITCSVFKKENEEMTAMIQDSFALQTENAGPVRGYEEKADTMYAARFVRA